MASSGRFKTDYVSGNYSFAVDWEITSQSIANNTSELKCTVKLISNDASYEIHSSVPKDLTLTVNGKTYSTTVSAELNGGKTKTLYTKTVTVPHNANGSKSCVISAKLGIEVTLSGTYFATFAANGTATLDTIPRASEIASVTSRLVVDGANKLKVEITRKSASFTHRVRIKFGAYETTITGVATSCEYAVPVEWLNAIPNSDTGTGTVFVTTFSGTTQIGSAASKGYTLAVPSNAKPTFTALGVERIDNLTPAAWGVYVQGKSKCKATVTGAAGIYGSTVKRYELRIGEIAGTAASLEADLPDAGTITVSGTVTDSRGRSFTRTATIEVKAYAAPRFVKARVYRALEDATEDDEGTYIGGIADYRYSAVGENRVTTKVEYKEPAGLTWIDAGTFGYNTAFALIGGLSVDQSYDVRLTLTDTFSTTRMLFGLPTGYTLMDLRKGGKGVAFGKVAEQDGFEVAMPARFTDDVAFAKAYSKTSTDLISNVADGFTITNVYAAKWGRVATIYITGTSTAAIPAGNGANKTICKVANLLTPMNGVPLTSGAAGGIISGHLSASGNVSIAAVAHQIAAGGEFSLGGSFICADESGKL